MSQAEQYGRTRIFPGLSLACTPRVYWAGQTRVSLHQLWCLAVLVLEADATPEPLLGTNRGQVKVKMPLPGPVALRYARSTRKLSEETGTSTISDPCQCQVHVSSRQELYCSSVQHRHLSVELLEGSGESSRMRAITDGVTSELRVRMTHPLIALVALESAPANEVSSLGANGLVGFSEHRTSLRFRAKLC